MVAARGGPPFEPRRVHVGVVHGQSVAARGLLDVARRPEGPAQPRDEGLQGVGRVGGRVLGPDRVDQHPLLDRTATGQRQPHEQALQPRARDGQVDLTAGHPEGAEQRGAQPRVPVHPTIFACPPPSPQTRA